MLPKSRIFSVLLLGLGVALLAAGLVAPAFLNFSPRLPLDLEKTTWTIKDESGHAQKLSGEGSEPYEGPLTYQIHMDIQDPSGEDEASLRVGETVMRGEAEGVGDLSSAEVWTYAIDRETGESTRPANLNHTLATPGAEVDVDGYWLKFPSDAQQTTYPVFDSTLRQSRDAVFEEEMDIDGRKVYRYHQEIEPVNVATLYSGFRNTTTLHNEDGSTEQGYLFHSGSRDFYVDQETGLLVGMDVKIDDYYGDRTGAGREQALVFEGQTPPEQRSALLQQAEKFPNNTVANIVRWSMLGLGGLLTLLGLLGALGLFGGRNRGRTKAHSAPAPRREPGEAVGVSRFGRRKRR